MGKRNTKIKIVSNMARMIGTCLLAFLSGLLIFVAGYGVSFRYFWLDELSSLEEASLTTVEQYKSKVEGYSAIEELTFPSYMDMQAGRAFLSDADTRSDCLVKMKWFHILEQSLSFRGVNRLTQLAHRNGFVCYFSDEFHSYRMAIKSVPYFFTSVSGLEKREPQDWVKKADPAYPYKDGGYFLQEETTYGYQVVFEVSNEKAAGFMKLEYDMESHMHNRVLYMENKEIYNYDRALETILSVTGNYHPVTTREEKLILEADALPENIGIETVLEGHPYELMKCKWKHSDVYIDKIGVYESTLVINGRELPFSVVVQDTLAPTVCENEYIFFEGDYVEAKWLEQNCFEDVSLPVKVSLQNGEEKYLVDKKAVQDGVLQIPLTVEDAKGNRTVCCVNLHVYDNEDLPEWYRFFMDMEDETLLKRVRMGELEELKEEYLDVGEDYLEEMLSDAVSGYKKAIRKDLDIQIEGKNWYGYEMMEFYAGIDSLPDSILDSYVVNNWKVSLKDEILYLGEMECAGITYYIDNEIVITSYYDVPYSFRATIVHEMGHFADWKLAFLPRDDEELEEYMADVRADMGLTEEQVQKWREEGCDYDSYYSEYMSGGYRNYSVIYTEEFFADSFYFYCVYPEKMKSLYPYVYQRMEELFEMN